MTNQFSRTQPLNPDSLNRGDRLGDIMLLELIGQGGEGQIWSGVDGRRQRIVAVKVIDVLEQATSKLAKVSLQFERQVHLVASIDHPNVLPLYHLGTSGSRFYFVMRYTPLGSLADLLEKGPLSLDETLYFAAQIALTLEHLHKKGVVHRDLKPSNILFGPERQIYLADFGLAKRLSNETMALHTGRGTGPYAPYEQHTMAQLTPQTDIYSLGIVIYEMLVGRLPWDGTTNLATRQFQDRVELPDIHQLDDKLPLAITQALREMTAFDWQQRPATASEALQLFVTAVDGISQKQFANLYSVPPVMEEDLLEASTAQELWQNLREQGSNPLYIPLTYLALLDSAYSKGDVEGLMRDETLRQFMLTAAIGHDYRLNYWWQQVKDPQARLRICEKALVQNDGAVVKRALNLLITLLGTAGITFSELLFDHLIDLAVNGSGAAVRSQVFDILESTVQEQQGWQPVGFTAEGDAKLARLALSESSTAGRAARLIGRVGSETAVQTLLAQQDKVEPDRFLNLLGEIQAAGSLPAVIPLDIRLRLWLRSFKKQLLEDSATLSWSRGLLGLLVGVVFSLLMFMGLFSQVDARMRDGLLTPYPVSNIVTIVAVDDDSLEEYGRWDEWPRSLHADLIEQLEAVGAKVIAFDVLFSSDTVEDARLLETMRTADNIILAVSGRDDALHNNPGRFYYDAGIFPETVFLEAATAVGHVNVLNKDGIVRRVPTIINIDEQPYAGLAIRALQVFLGINYQSIPEPEDGFLSIAGRDIPVGEHGDMYLYFAGPPARPGFNTFQTVRYMDVIEGEVDPDLFRDKIVLIGMTATAEPDNYLTAVSSDGRQMYGVEILANTIETIWSRKFITRPSDLTRAIVLLFLGVLTGLLCTRPFSGLVLAGVTGMLYFLFASLLFDSQGVMLDILLPFLTIAASYVVVTTYRYAVESRRRREMQNLFADHLAPELTERALTAVQQGRLKLDGQEQAISVLMIDLQTGHDFSLAYEPEQVVALFEEHLDLITETLFAEEGTIVTTSNHQIVAMFNSPLRQADHEQRAVLTAVKIRDRLHNFTPSLSLNQAGPFIIGRYAVDAGRAVVGYNGTSVRNAFSVVGSPLQTAAHLITQAAPDQILITQAAFDRLDEDQKNKASPTFSNAGDAHTNTIYNISG